MSEPSTYVDPLHGISGEIISAMSALNMEPEPLPQPNGIFLSETDKWASHAMEHLREAMNQQRKAEGKIYALQARLAQCEGERKESVLLSKRLEDELLSSPHMAVSHTVYPELYSLRDKVKTMSTQIDNQTALITRIEAERDAALERVNTLEAAVKALPVVDAVWKQPIIIEKDSRTMVDIGPQVAAILALRAGMR